MCECVCLRVRERERERERDFFFEFTHCTVRSSKGNIISCLGIFVTPLSLILADCVCTVSHLREI